MLPKGVAGSQYTALLEATGGYPPYSWSAEGLPSQLTLSESGTISGNSALAGESRFQVTVSDNHIPPDTATAELILMTCPLGDANEDGLINKADVYKFDQDISWNR